MVICVVVVITIPLGIITFQRFRDAAATLERASALFPNPIEPLPELDAEAFLIEQHRRCFAESYTGAWFRKELDERAYLECVNAAYAEQVRDVAVLEDPVLRPHENPSFTELEYTVRAVGGELPESMTESTRTDCGDPNSYGFGSSPATASGFDEVADGTYRVRTGEGLGATPCRLRLTLDYRGWPLSEPLEVDLPAWDPVAKAAEDARHRRYREDVDSVSACIRQAASGVPRSGWGELTPELESRVRILQNGSGNEATDTIRELKRMGPEARPAVPMMVDSLARGQHVEVAVSEAFALIAPDAPELASVVHCLLGHPNPGVGTVAAVSLIQMGDSRGVEALGSILTASSDQLKLSTLVTILSARSGMKAAAPAVAHCALSDPSAEIRARALMVLPPLDPESPAVEATLRRAQDDPDPAVRAQAESSLRTLPSLKARRSQY